MGHLTIAKNQVYLDLARRLNENPVGAPFSETLLQILYRMYTETQAHIGTNFPKTMVTIDHLIQQTGMNKAELETNLESMADKGLVVDVSRKGTTYYLLSPLVIGFFEYTFMRVTDKLPISELADLFEAYHHEKGVAQEFFGVDTKLFQTWAYEGLMPEKVESEILTYEKASDMIRDAGGGSLTMCYCRHHAKHLGKNCAAPIEDVCTSLGSAAEWLIRRGFARPASVDELLRVLDKTEKLGLVHMADNVQNSPAYICHCCGCCCGVLRAAREHRFLTAQPSNFSPSLNDEKCNGCGACTKRCHVEALTTTEMVEGDKKSRKAKLTEEFCLGCGACIRACKQGALALVQRKTLFVPPKNKKEQMRRISLEKGKLPD